MLCGKSNKVLVDYIKFTRTKQIHAQTLHKKNQIEECNNENYIKQQLVFSKSSSKLVVEYSHNFLYVQSDL